MIKFVFTPGFGVMTILAFFPELTLMFIVELMTSITFRGPLLVIGVLALFVTLITQCVFMRPRKFKLSVLIMIEVLLSPSGR